MRPPAPRTPRRGRRWPVAVTAALTALAALALGAGQNAASADEDGADASRTVTYQGYEIDVPSDWRVVDLDEDPTACVRFDRPAVYLGTPAEQQDCPAHLVGRTAGLVIEPLADVSAERVGQQAPGTIQRSVKDAGLLVTAAHALRHEGLVRDILDTARVTEDADPAAAPAPRERQGRPGTLQAGPQPGDFLGDGFDQCAAPSQEAMDAWLSDSPYQAVGVYISGGQRGCDQPNLTADWVETQTANGWHLIPIDVGLQAPCSSYADLISTDPATAREQGTTAAAGAVAEAQALGIPEGSAIYSDIEAYSTGGSCTTGVLNYLSGWTEGLHASGYLSGVYSSAGSGIGDVAAYYDDTAYTRVDHIWFAWWNDQADTDAGSYVPAEYWADHQRLHQHAGNVTETWGGVSINIDRNYLDVGQGTVPSPSCGGVSLDFASYPELAAGDAGSEVSAAQCQLAAAGFSPGEATPTGEFDAATVAAVEAFQADRGMTVDGAVTAATWTALLSTGDTPQVANGSTGEAVSRLQRALTAALGGTVAIDGEFGPETEQAVLDYQTSRGLDADGIVGPLTWEALQAGS
jgi:glycoside hydrolase-like protein/putative peptidoglycan binding protein